jgi:hypothetical protein
VALMMGLAILAPRSQHYNKNTYLLYNTRNSCGSNLAGVGI